MLALLLITVVAQAVSKVDVTPPDFAGSREPQIAIGDDGRTYVTYGKGNELFVSISSDLGKSYSAPIKVGEAGNLSLGMRRGPRIAVHKSTLTIVATYGVQGKGRDGDLVTFRSTDKGASWIKAGNVNDVSGSAREGLHGMAVSKTGTIACAWLDLRAKGTQLFLAVSRDGGASWSDNRLIYKSPSETICECCHPSLTFDQKETLHVMFRNSLAGARDMYLTSSKDMKVFSPASKLGEGTWLLNACPMDGGMLEVDDQGNVHAVWRREGDIYVTSAIDSERRLSDGKNPWVARSALGPVFVWNVGSEVRVLIGNEPTISLTAAGGDPVVASSPDGKFIVAAWSDGGIKSVVLGR